MPLRTFQFPTGWNSTRDCWNEAKESEIVSIPNGMEFYKNWKYPIEQKDSFNSQRDGILQIELKTIDIGIAGFNSQRDGILHLQAVKVDRHSSKFQFPTGWNSTYAECVKALLKNVSIPNGMEFYHP